MKKIYGLFIAVFVIMLGMLIYDCYYPTWKDSTEIDTTMVNTVYDTVYVGEPSEVDSLETICIDSTLINSEAVD